MVGTTRQRAQRGALNRGRILDAALNLIGREGLKRLTMPRLAADLGVGTMSLYRHVASKPDLIDALAERIAATVELPDESAGDCVDRIASFLVNWRRAASSHPGMAEVMVRRVFVSESLRGQVEQGLAILVEGGFDRRDAHRCFSSAFRYVIGSVVWEQSIASDNTAASSPGLGEFARNSISDQELRTDLERILRGKSGTVIA